MGKVLTKKQAAAAIEEGDEIEFDDLGNRSIEGFTELVAEIKALVAAQRANAGADMLRSENFEQLLGLLQDLVSRPAAGMNTDGLEQILLEMQSHQPVHGQIAYEFNVKRDGNGFMHTITATPVAPTTH